MFKVLLLLIWIISFFSLLVEFEVTNPLISLVSILAVMIIPLYFSISALRKLHNEGIIIEGIEHQLFQPGLFFSCIKGIKYSPKTTKKSPLRDNRTSKYLDQKNSL